MTRTVLPEDIREISSTLAAGNLVALPTETVYGLGAIAENESAVKEIFEVKGRPQDNPLIVHCSSVKEAFSLGKNIPEYAELLAEFWPGPLTLVFESSVNWPWVQAGHSTIAVRVPDVKYLRDVIRMTSPIAAPSANLSGKPSPTDAAHCREDLDGKVPLIVDGGRCKKGVESTVVDCTGDKPVILRPGPVTAEEINAVVELADEGSAASPGTIHKHYTPNAKVVLVDAIPKETNCMTITSEESNALLSRVYTDLPHLAHNLFAWFREADEKGIKTIYFQSVPEEGLGRAIMNRVKKAAHR